MKYLFWNTHKNKNINSILCDLIIENNISIVVLAEYTADINELCHLIRWCGVSMQPIPTVGCDRIHILGEIGVAIQPELQTSRVSMQIINENTILCCVHLNSQIYSGNIDRRQLDIEQIVFDILRLERELNTKNTIVVGDFNINPYDECFLNARYFHAIPVCNEAMRGSRIVAEREFQMFYNPMWNFLGDFREPYGTYYYSSSEVVNPYWNIYDQVIIRPALRKQFVDDNLRIITETKTTQLLDDKKHPNTHISDHLPITFEIKEEERAYGT